MIKFSATLFASLFLLLTPASEDKLVYLTYDDGPDPRYTPALLEVLDRHGVKATFFMNGVNMEAHPDLVATVHKAGHTLANHNYTHVRPDTFTDAAMAEAIEKTDALIRAVSGQQEVLYRAPFLQIIQSNKSYLCRTGRNSVDVDMSGLDWETQDPDQIIQNLMRGLKPGAVILLHDSGGGPNGTRMGTAEASDKLIPKLRDMGYRFADTPPTHRWQLSDTDCE